MLPLFRVVVTIPPEHKGIKPDVYPLPWKLCQHHADTVSPQKLIPSYKWEVVVEEMKKLDLFLPPYGECEFSLMPLDEEEQRI